MEIPYGRGALPGEAGHNPFTRIERHNMSNTEARNKYEVGQTVWIVSVNDGKRGPTEVKVKRVGRKLVYVEQYGREVGFRISDGVINDAHEHEHLETPEQRASHALRADLLERLRSHSFDVKPSVSTSVIAAVVATLDSIERS